MKKRNLISIILLTFALMFTCFTISFAEPSGLIVVRASDDTLWKATCDGTTCTAFTSFPGLFGSQPTVYWDENIQRYVLWGRASNNTIWRSTFTRTGTFNNDWVQIPGLTPSPIGAGGGGITNNFVGSGQSGSVELTSTITNIKSVDVNTPWDGFVVCNVSGQLHFSRSSTSGTSYAIIYITQTSGGSSSTYSAADLPSGTPTGVTSFPFAFQRWFSVSPGEEVFYATGVEGGSAAATTTTTMYDTLLNCQYQPYSY